MNARKEAQLISHAKAGNTESFAEIVGFYQDQVFRFVSNMIGSNAAEDVAQEIFIATFRNLWRYDSGKASFRTWLFRIARNQALNFVKKHRNDQLQRSDELQTTDELPDRSTPADHLLQKEIFIQLDRAVAALAFRDRVIFTLSDIEGLTYAQIAEIEGVRLGTVKSRLSRVRAKLRALIEGYLNE